MRSQLPILALTAALALTSFLSAPTLLADESEEDSMTDSPTELGGWLQLGPVAVPLPAFHDQEKKPFKASNLLETTMLEIDGLWPEAGDEVRWAAGETLRWQRVSPSPELSLVRGEGQPAIAYLATYLEADRFTLAKLEVDSAHPMRVYLDGEQVAERAKSGEGSDAAEKKTEENEEASAGDGAGKATPTPLTAELPLDRGKHLLLLALVADPDQKASWGVSGKIKAPAGSLKTSTEPRRTLRLGDILDVPTTTAVEFAADGERLAISLTQPAAPSENSQAWTEITTRQGKLVQTLHGGETSFGWAPNGHRYAYITRDEETADLWVAELGGGSRRVLEKAKNLGGFRWMPDGLGMVYWLSEKSEADERGVKRYRGLRDRWAGWRDIESLYHLSLEDGTRRRLTAGGEAVGLQDIAPDGRFLLLSVEAYSRTEWPYARSDLFELDLATLEAKSLRRITWFGSARYSPGGKSIAIAAGPSGFGADGRDDGIVDGPLNEYDAQLYLLDRKTLEVDPISRDFDPSVLSYGWIQSGDLIIHAQVEDRAQLFRYRVGERRFDSLEVELDLVEGWSAARETGAVAYFGSSVQKPQQVMTHSGKPGTSPKTVLRPAAEELADLELGRVEDWSFDSETAGPIVGRVYYPPGFDAERKYPLIVYYYGGALPTDRAFGGRYPKDYWAAQGYVVYVLQPSGATGFGQDFSARHVNDWGGRVAEEIIDGTRRFLAAHPFVDADRVGCIGASYGGFMTSLLQTRTDLFSAAVSHAGISSISSYWGQGWWAYLYSAVAGAQSYPWNNPELYVGQSPLFSADKIQTPLLLLHGDADTNVPLGESQQLYTALELLGKEVELLTFAGENHRIADRDKRELWSRSIIAWFDRWLKSEPAYWEHLMGTAVEPKG